MMIARKNPKTVSAVGAAALAATLAVSAVSSAFAQTAPTPGAGATGTPSTTTTQPNGPQRRDQNGTQPGPGGPTQGHDGAGADQRGGPGGERGPRGEGSVAGVSGLLTQVKADRDFAVGKMDLATVNALVASAEALINSQPAQPAGLSAPAADTAATRTARGTLAAAATALRSAEELLRANLDGQLPSQANRPARPAPPATAPQANLQLGASREAARAYQGVAAVTALSKANATVDTRGFVAAAQAIYGQAYTAYQAGQYDKAGSLARAADSAAQAAMLLLRAANATEQPVAVPAPSF